MKRAREPFTTGDDPLLGVTQRTVPAVGTFPPPSRAANSVFDAGARAKPPAIARPRVAIDLATVEIRKNVPMPEVRAKPPGYTGLLDRMEVGDSVALPSRQAYSLYSAAKKLAGTRGGTVKYVLRKIDDDTHGIWRAV